MLLVNSIYASVPESSICCGTRLKKAVYRSPVLSAASRKESVVQTRKESEKLIESLDRSFTPNDKMNEAMDLANRIIQNSESYKQEAND